ncbi:DUF177 domain-containing protein [Holzapfeliella floricola]|uniref:DUF177 domain-containing protein n=1 Tax=Holzapfeliella floricola DSM 23037 = JCM 16512 TaxID=1423744 RepID=A0A0R2DIH7_9LACO|nr:DUF177 domain-containing protein [Holzapfeliella floricola]KRN03889.1 hypothetical protein FC86_GL001001 [Holzapfeliella floricola DSM 23037 = JCM 16512]
MLKYNFSDLIRYENQFTSVEQDIDLTDVLKERTKNMIEEAKHVQVTGELINDQPFVISRLHVKVDLVVLSTRSLTPIRYPLSFSFDEAYTDTKPREEDFDLYGTIIEVENDKVELQKAIEDNIILNLPTKILTEEEKQNDEMPSGNTWQVMSEEDYFEQKEKTKTSPFAKLGDLLEDNDDKK